MTRQIIPARRPSEVFQFEHNGIAFSGALSRLAVILSTGAVHLAGPVEVFLDGGKPGTAVQAVARDTAVAASIALQYGAPLAVIRNALTRNDDGSPAGPLGALLDLIESEGGPA